MALIRGAYTSFQITGCERNIERKLSCTAIEVNPNFINDRI